MKTLKDMKEAVANASHLTLVDTNKPHKYVGVKRELGHTNTVGFALKQPFNNDLSYCGWPKTSELSFVEAHPNRFTITHSYVTLTYEITPLEKA